MRRFRMRILVLLASMAAFAAPKPKYGPEATPLSADRGSLATAPAPDFWAMIPYYSPQLTGSSCSLAAVVMTLNAARAKLVAEGKLTADDELATEENTLEKVKKLDAALGARWARAVGSRGGGSNLDQLAEYAGAAFRAFGFAQATATAVHAEDLTHATQARLRSALAENERSTEDFLILNFNQGVYTGDADVGHIAPLAAYDEAKNRALVMDPDRKWYEPYWVSEPTLLKGMATRDSSASKNRGWVHIRLRGMTALSGP